MYCCLRKKKVSLDNEVNVKKKNLNWSLLIVLVESLILISIEITKLHLAAFFRNHPVYRVCQKVRTSVSVACHCIMYTPILYQKLFCSFQLKKELSETENENGSNAIGT
jgi:hypothetical protein